MMRAVVQLAQEWEQRPEWREALGYVGRRSSVIFSADNATVHGKEADRASLGIAADEWMTCPARSPDFHKPIEHLFGRIKPAFARWLHSHPAPRTVDAYKAKVEELFEQYAAPAQVAKDVATMFDTFDGIIEAEGGWPPKAQR